MGNRRGDADVVTMLRARQAEGMSLLYDRYGGLVYSVILRIVRNAYTAEDLVQETFLRIWSRAKLFDSERGDLRSWVVAIGRHCAFDYLRSSEGRNDRSASDGVDRLAGVLLSESLLPEYSDASLGKAIGRLTDNQRQALELAYFEGMSQTEIAQKLQQPLGTVKTWVRTALRLLRGELCVMDAGDVPKDNAPQSVTAPLAPGTAGFSTARR